jgi:hypothetical protein
MYSLLIIDDSMLDAQIMKRAAEISIRDIHHTSSNLIVIVQRLYVNDANYRILFDQATHVILFKIVKGHFTLSRFVADIFPLKLRDYFWDSYNEATSKPFGYILVDITGNSPINACLYTNICDKLITFKHGEPIQTLSH